MVHRVGDREMKRSRKHKEQKRDSRTADYRDLTEYFYSKPKEEPDYDTKLSVNGQHPDDAD